MSKRKPESEKLPRGRKTKYNPEFHPLLIRELARNGHTLDEMARELKIAVSTIEKWRNDFPDFSEALRIGRDAIDDQVENALLKRALGFENPNAVKIFCFQGKIKEVTYTEYYPPDVTAAFKWLINRRPDKWHDRKEITGEGGKPLEVKVVIANSFSDDIGSDAK